MTRPAWPTEHIHDGSRCCPLSVMVEADGEVCGVHVSPHVGCILR